MTTQNLLRLLQGGSRGPFDLRVRLISQLQLRPGLHEYPDLIDALWGDDEDGGPDNPLAVIAVMTCRLRQAGYPICTIPWQGLRWDEQISAAKIAELA